ncbi:hypothetical protein FN846DRAFT_323096 [Sphaerosporella brunnea]|uniref:Uncharacterized protein n=1 Tax=Sphaerosporella brunnea TaxID=1250544 RepID=A0A5J5F6Z3_9PEZI|nr:hypothetical protein FN846DRAFT_323096 [Sphaerosporella brunnea]
MMRPQTPMSLAGQTGSICPLRALPHDGNRHVMLVAYYNTNTPYSALSQMSNFVYRGLFSSKLNGKWKVNWNTLGWALVLAGVSLTIIVASLVTPLFIGGRVLIVRHAARANPNQMFYPATSVGATPGFGTFDQLRPVRSPAAFQALGRIAAARDNLAKAIKMDAVEGNDPNGRGRTVELSYAYSISGYDMGLQHATGLVYGVSGHCRTEYDWLQTNWTDGRDWYPLWGSTYAKRVSVPITNDSALPPFVNIVNLPTFPTSQYNRSQGWEFSLVPNVQGRKSPTNNTNDAWFLTEEDPTWTAANASIRQYLPRYRVERGRPPVRCWQNDTWSLGGNQVYDVQNLGGLNGLRLSTFFRDKVFPSEFYVPPMVQLANNLGYSWMNAAIYTVANTKSFDASHCNTTEELTRLVQLGFLASREVVRNTVQVYSYLLAQPAAPLNLAAVNGVVPPESADFIIESKDVAAMQIAGLLAVPLVSGLLWFLVFLRGLVHSSNLALNNSSLAARHNRRAISLQATQLYRYLDEKISGENRWSGRIGVPYIRDIESPTAPPENQSFYIRPKFDRVPTESSPAVSSQVAGSAGESANTGGEKDGAAISVDTAQAKKQSFLSKLMFWSPRSPKEGLPKYELVMTRRWENFKPGESGRIVEHHDQVEK